MSSIQPLSNNVWTKIVYSFPQVDITPTSRDYSGMEPIRLIKLDVREPRLRRVHYGRVLANHPVNEEFQEQLSKPFYFRQKEHGAITEVLFPKTSESPEIAAFKKGKSNIKHIGICAMK